MLNYFDGANHPDGLAWQSDEVLNQALSGLAVMPSVSSLNSQVTLPPECAVVP